MNNIQSSIFQSNSLCLRDVTKLDCIMMLRNSNCCFLRKTLRKVEVRVSYKKKLCIKDSNVQTTQLNLTSPLIICPEWLVSLCTMNEISIRCGFYKILHYKIHPMFLYSSSLHGGNYCRISDFYKYILHDRYQHQPPTTKQIQIHPQGIVN